MSYRREVSESTGSSRLPRQYSIGPRSKTMIEDTPTSRQRSIEKELVASPGFTRRYGSARYQRSATIDLPGSPIQSGRTTTRYNIGSARPGGLETSTHDHYSGTLTSYSPLLYGRQSPLTHDTSSSQYSPTRKYTPSSFSSQSSYLKDKPSYSSLGGPYSDTSRNFSKYTSTRERDWSVPSPVISRRFDASSPNRSSTSSSRDSSGSRKSSLGKDGRVFYVGRYSGRSSPVIDSEARRGSEPLAKNNRTPFIRSYSMRDRDYPLKHNKHQAPLERKASLPSYIAFQDKSSDDGHRKIPLPETVAEERSRKGSWLRSLKKNESEKTSKKRSDSTSPGSGKSKFAISQSPSVEQSSDAGGSRKKFSVPSKYFSSSKGTVGSRDSEGSTEMIDVESSGVKKKHSLPTKFSFKKRSSSKERSPKTESAPATPITSSPELRERPSWGRSFSVDNEQDRTFATMMGRLRFWDKKQKTDGRSRSQSPDEHRQRSNSSPLEDETDAPPRPPLPDDYSKPSSRPPSKVLVKAKSLDDEKEGSFQNSTDSDKVRSWTKVEIVSKRVEKEVAELIKTANELDDSPREQRRARYRKTSDGKEKPVYSISMDAAMDSAKAGDGEDLGIIAATRIQPRPHMQAVEPSPDQTRSEKLREKRRQRRLEREKFFESFSPPTEKKVLNQQSLDSDSSLGEAKQSRSLSLGSCQPPVATTQRPARLTLKVSEEATQTVPVQRVASHTYQPNNEPFSGEIFSRYICEDDTSRTLLESSKRKEERPHSICGGPLSPDEMKKFEDITFSLARKTSSEEMARLPAHKRWSSSSTETSSAKNTEDEVGANFERDKPLTVVAEACEVEKKVVVRSKTVPKVEVKRKVSSGGEERIDGPLMSIFKRKTSTVPSDKEKKDNEKARLKEMKDKEKIEKEKREKDKREREEKERKRRQQQLEKEKKEKEKKLLIEKEKREKEKQKERLREKEEKEKQKEAERAKKEKERLLQEDKLHEKEEKDRKDKEKRKVEKEKREKDKQVEKEKKDSLKRVKKRKDSDKERKVKEKEEEQKVKIEKEPNKVTEVQLMVEETNKEESPSTDRDAESELPKAGSVSALLSVFATEPSKPLKPAIRYSRKNRPKTLAVGIAPEILKAAREQVNRDEMRDRNREELRDRNITHDDFDVRLSLPSTPTESEEAGQELHLLQETQQAEEEQKITRRETKKSKSKSRKKSSSTVRPFGMMKHTKSESNLNNRFEFIQVDIAIDDADQEKTQQDEKKDEKKVIELKPVSKVTVPQAVSDLMLSRVSGKKPSQTVPQIEQADDDQQNDNRSDQPKGGFDEGLDAFFGETSSKHSPENKDALPKIKITSEDLDVISGQTTVYLKSKAEDKLHLKPKRRHASKANPVKNLRERTDVRTETEVTKTSPRVEKKAVTSEHPVIRRKKKKYKDPDNLWRRHTVDFAASALAGLASTEDFTKISLRKTGGPEKAKELDSYRGTKPLMLLHIKGRRNIQTRLIEPCQKSFNSGDCYVLVTKDELFAWVGKHANAIERAKVTEIASRIFTKRELDCKARDIVFVEEKSQDEDNLRGAKKFWKLLNGDPEAEIKEASSLPTDEDYEKGVTRTNMIYKVHWTDPPSLVPVETHCGRLPQISLLDTKEVLVFDFGSELYVWNGQQSLSGQRKTVFALGKQLYESSFKGHGPYDPIYPYGKGREVTQDNKTADTRPAWTLLARLHEKAETILFREKFLDWPDPTKIIKMKGHPSSGEVIKPLIVVELKPCDPKALASTPEPFKGQVLEGVNVGRGIGVPTVWTGDFYKEGNLCNTVGVTVWHINEYRHYELPNENHGHFHSGEGYVIRWAYFVMTDRIATDRKSRCRSTVAGRVRTAYFFWQGNDCTVNEKGAAAVMAVELDEERGPQIRVTQGKEPPCFLNLFKGGMIVHSGKRDHMNDKSERFSDTSTVRLYVVRNDEPGEGCLVQVRLSGLSLRSRGCFVLLMCRDGKVFVWYGAKALDDTKKNALVAAKNIQAKKPMECNVENTTVITLQEVQEGEEPEEFLKALGGKKYYCSLLNDPSPHQFTPRLYELSSATGKFMANEVLCPSRLEGKVCQFPFLQDDMYSAKQPGLFLLDNHYEVCIWEGWIPEDDIDSLTGSGKQRWDNDRKLAMETALKYAEEVGKRVSHRVFVVYAGLEPMSFKAAFPHWTDRASVISIQKQSGKQPGAKEPVTELLQTFTKDSYTLSELQEQPPPQGVDPAKLETYLSNSDFQEVFKMGKEDFTKLPGWKQQNLKKAVKLF
ncbi:supervillin isoform X2 [Nematostella vectensis]|uniref:supervillin isoform X2 n=1 Tax=Nematostella vectensis TaxID=45351 RepID=UPI00139007D5|nr:supervillin isoform X2 [Nematostella vectensis]